MFGTREVKPCLPLHLRPRQHLRPNLKLQANRALETILSLPNRMKVAKHAHAKTRASAQPVANRIDASILVVDDEAMIRKVVGRGLTAAGCTVVYAADGEEALARLTEALPDLVISDVTMPRMDGFELVKRIRSQAATKALPVILLTGRGDTEDLVAGMGLGADDYLVKPFALRELLARVRAKIERPPVPASSLMHERPAGVLSEEQFALELEREVSRAKKTNRRGVLAHIGLHELVRLRTRFSSRVQDQIELQAVALMTNGATPSPQSIPDAYTITTRSGRAKKPGDRDRSAAPG